MNGEMHCELSVNNSNIPGPVGGVMPWKQYSHVLADVVKPGRIVKETTESISPDPPTTGIRVSTDGRTETVVF